MGSPGVGAVFEPLGCGQWDALVELGKVGGH